MGLEEPVQTPLPGFGVGSAEDLIKRIPFGLAAFREEPTHLVALTDAPHSQQRGERVVGHRLLPLRGFRQACVRAGNREPGAEL